jgi:hypothetical protein
MEEIALERKFSMRFQTDAVLKTASVSAAPGLSADPMHIRGRISI